MSRYPKAAADRRSRPPPMPIMATDARSGRKYARLVTSYFKKSTSSSLPVKRNAVVPASPSMLIPRCSTTKSGLSFGEGPHIWG
jgi:hypothetical protein